MFAAVASGRPLQMSQEVPNTNSLQHTIGFNDDDTYKISHMTIFTLPNIDFPAGYYALIYFKIPQSDEFKLFGYISRDKPSAIFKINSGSKQGELGEIEMTDDVITELPSTNELIIGIQIETEMDGQRKLQEATRNISSTPSNALVLSGSAASSSAPQTPGELAQMYPQVTQQLANRIVSHAYNYLSSFVDSQGKVSVKTFDSWWDKFKQRLRNDGKFLDTIS